MPESGLDDSTQKKIDSVATTTARVVSLVVATGAIGLGSWGFLAIIFDLWRGQYVYYSSVLLLACLMAIVYGSVLLRKTLSKREPL